MASPGSVVVDAILAFRGNSTNEVTVHSQFLRNLDKAARYNLDISRITGNAASPARVLPHARNLSPANAMVPGFLLGASRGQGGGLEWGTSFERLLTNDFSL